MICKNGGRNDETHKQTRKPYDKGDNDYYWFNWKDKNTFYVIPERELVNRGFITNENSMGHPSIAFTLNKDWIDNYKFSYDTINEKKNKQKWVVMRKYKNSSVVSKRTSDVLI